MVGFGIERCWNSKLVIWVCHFAVFKRCAEAPKCFIHSQNLNLGKAVLCACEAFTHGDRIAKRDETAMLNYENVEAVY